MSHLSGFAFLRSTAESSTAHTIVLHAYVMLHDLLLQDLLNGRPRLGIWVQQSTNERLDFGIVGVWELSDDVVNYVRL